MPRLSEEQQKLPAFDLKALREKQVLSQGELADVLFTTQASVARWEQNGNLPPLHRAYLALVFTKPRKVKKSVKKA